MSHKWKLPPPAEVLKAIAEWRELNLNVASREQVQNDFERIFETSIKFFSGERSECGFSYFYRIREMDSLIGHVDQLWAPPPDKTPRSRCNFKNEPVLYVSADGANCFEELNVDLGKSVYLIRYEKKRGSLRLRSVYGTDWESIELDDLVFDSEADKLSYKILREFLRSEFMKPTCRQCDGSDFVYHVTASIVAFLKASMDVDGFVYPSAVNVFSKNIVLFPEREKEKLRIKDVRIVKLISREEDKVKYESLFNGSIVGEQVHWVPCSGQDHFRKMSWKGRKN